MSEASNCRVLNEASVKSPGVPVVSPGEEVAAKVQKLMLQLKGHFMTEDGQGVDYSSLRESELFKEYQDQCQQLSHVDVGRMTESQKKAFFINVYNTLTIHGLAVQEQLPSSVLDVADFWSRTCYNIGGLVFSLDDIEHGVLRGAQKGDDGIVLVKCRPSPPAGNRPHPSKTTPTYFVEGDPRVHFCLPTVDPRIHFALVCGAKSCPPIQVYTPSNLDRGLDAAACNFVSQEVTVDKEARTVTVSKIFLWYARDFGQDERQLMQWLHKYLPEDRQADLQEMLDSEHKIRVEAKMYNWNLNEL